MSASVDIARVTDTVAAIRDQLRHASGRDVGIVAVTKSFGVDALYAAQAAGCDAVGENYAQELVGKIEQMRNDPRGLLAVPVHFIGHVQSNKVKQLAPHVDLWQSIDRKSVVQELARRVGSAGRILIQVNTTEETTKDGCAPSEVSDLVEYAVDCGLEVRGLMTIGPTRGDRRELEAAFRLCRSLADSLNLAECSMGMSDDYLVAGECGSTMVRLGSALFGARRSDAIN